MALIVKSGTTEVTQVKSLIAGQLADGSKRLYEQNIARFVAFVDKPLWDVTKADIVAYRDHLLHSGIKRRTAQSRFSIVRRLFQEALNHPDLAKKFTHGDPSANVRGITVAGVATKHVALEKRDARILLDAALDQSDPKLAARDFLLISLLLRTGLRRAELAQLCVGMIEPEGAFWKVTIVGKGDKERTIKIPDDVKQQIDDYLATRSNVSPASPLLPALRHTLATKGIAEPAISADEIYRTVRRIGAKIGYPKLTAHSMRATFITLALEGHAPLHVVQFHVGHADPRTTEVYIKRRDNLKNSAADAVRL